MDLPHRDDFDMEVVKQIEDEVRRLYGKQNIKVVFPGDMGNIPPHLKAQMDAVQARLDNSILNGECMSCGLRMMNYPDVSSGPDAMKEDWYPMPGWSSLNSAASGCPEAWLCPQCGTGRAGATLGIGIPFDDNGDS